MKLVDMKIADFADLLSSASPAPGGGSAAALEGAIGASLTAMVASLTIGKKKYAEYDELAQETLKTAIALKNKFIDVIDRDTEAFNGMSAVFAMPKETESEKSARQDAMQSALKNCTKTPFEMMELSLATLELTSSIVGKSNKSASSDLGVSALSIKAAVQGAWLNILINIGGIKDENFTGEYRKKGELILAKALPLADEIYDEILKNL
ncbi:MAG: cyclodeaminase/cyclohydrolase family protein [Oscillospiraceae bacterium]